MTVHSAVVVAWMDWKQQYQGLWMAAQARGNNYLNTEKKYLKLWDVGIMES